jgi:MFS family permease
MLPPPPGVALAAAGGARASAAAPAAAAGCGRNCLCRAWLLLLIAGVGIDRMLIDWPGSAFPWLLRQGWTGLQQSAQFAVYFAAAIPMSLLGGVCIDWLGPATVLLGAQLPLVLGAALLFIGPVPAATYPSRVLTSAFVVSELAAAALIVESFGASGAGLAMACGRCCGGGGGGGGKGGSCWHDFPQLAFGTAFLQVIMRASMIIGFILAPVLLNTFGWMGIFFVPLFATVGLLSAAGAYIVDRGVIPCCAASTWRRKNGRGAVEAAAAGAAAARESAGAKSAFAEGGGVGAEDDDDAGTDEVAPLVARAAAATPPDDGVARAALSRRSSDAGAPPPPSLRAAVCERLNFCQPELKMPLVVLNGFISELARIFYLSASTQVAGVLFQERFGLDDIAANTLVVWMKLTVLLVLLPASFLLDARIIGYHAMLIAGAATMLLGWSLLAFQAAAPPALMSVFAGLGFSLILASAPPLFAMRVRAAVRGRISSFFWMLQSLGLLIISLVFGAMRDASPPAAEHTSLSATSLYVVVAGSAGVLAMCIALAALDGCKEPARVYEHEQPEEAHKAA